MRSPRNQRDHVVTILFPRDDLVERFQVGGGLQEMFVVSKCNKIVIGEPHRSLWCIRREKTTLSVWKSGDDS